MPFFNNNNTNYITCNLCPPLVSFHVGSGCQTPSAYQDALAMCAEMFQYGTGIGYRFSLLDIGGGYPGEKGSEDLFKKVTTAINQALSEHFSSSLYPSLDIIAEPGEMRSLPVDCYPIEIVKMISILLVFCIILCQRSVFCLLHTCSRRQRVWQEACAL